MMKAILVFLCATALPAMAVGNYGKDRVYTGNQVSNTVSVVAPATNTLLGEIVLGNPAASTLSPLYKGQSLVHGLGYSPINHTLAVVSIGSNAVTLIDTTTNQVLKTIYVGRAPHEATFTPDGREVWVTVRGEDYISVISVVERKEVRQIKVANGPGMVAFTPDGSHAYVCSSFTPTLDVIDAESYAPVKQIMVVSPFSPNIFPCPNGKYLAMTHKDVGKVSLIDAKKQEITQTISTGPLTNHVTFAAPQGRMLMLVTVGGENAIKVYDIDKNMSLIATIPVGMLPHGAWPSADGKMLYVGLEYSDAVQPVDLITMKALPAIQVGQSPQALLYAKDATQNDTDAPNLVPLKQMQAPISFAMGNLAKDSPASGKIAIRSIGLNDLVEQLFLKLTPNANYSLALAKDAQNPAPDLVLNSFTTDEKGKYAGLTQGLIKNRGAGDFLYKTFILIDLQSSKIIMKATVSE